MQGLERRDSADETEGLVDYVTETNFQSEITSHGVARSNLAEVLEQPMRTTTTFATCETSGSETFEEAASTNAKKNVVCINCLTLAGPLLFWRSIVFQSARRPSYHSSRLGPDAAYVAGCS